jgi:hypothetical protein
MEEATTTSTVMEEQSLGRRVVGNLVERCA